MKIFNFRSGSLALLLLATIHSPLASADREIQAGQKVEAVIGTGYRTDTEKFVGRCVKGTEVYSGKPQSNVDFSQTLSKSQLAKELGFDAGGSARFGAAEVSASAKYMKASTSNAFSITMVYSGDYRFRNLYYQDPVLSPLGTSVQQNVERWEETCGTEFVEQIGQGAKLFFTIRIDFSSEEERSSFEASFSYKATMAKAHANLKTMSKSFSQNTSVVVSALQMGGNVDRITGLFQGTGSEGNQSLGFVQCTFGDFSKCDAVLANALSYATDLKNGFPSQLKKNDENKEGGPAHLFYLTKTYQTAGIYDAYPKEVAVAIKTSRNNLIRTFDGVLDSLTKASYLLNEGQVLLSPRQRGLLAKEEEKLNDNLQKIVAAAMTCYEKPLECIEKVADLNPGKPNGLVAIDETVFVVKPETFRQYCALAKTVVATPELRDSIRGMITAAKEMESVRFAEVDGQKPDECLVTHLILQDREEISFKGKGIKTLLPIAEYKHWKKLDLSDNQVRDLFPIAAMSSLEDLNLSKNKIRETQDLVGLSSLKILDLSQNQIRDVQALGVIAELERLDIRENMPEITCPANSRIKSCLVASLDLIGQFIDLGSILPRAALEPAASDLENGQALVTGLFNSTAEGVRGAALFDKKKQTFTLVGSTTFARRGHSSTKLQDGRVLIVGGWEAPRHFEIFDPITKTFLQTQSLMTSGRAGHTATLLKDGRVLLAGGYHQGRFWTGQSANYTAEIFDPKTNRIAKVIQMKTARAWHTASVLADGRVFLVGGFASNAGNQTAEIFDPKSDEFAWAKDQMREGRGAHTASVLKDGRIFLAGGFKDSENPIKSAEIYDPRTEKFNPVFEELKTARGHHTANVLNDGKVLLVGGSSKVIPFDTFGDNCESCLDVGEIFDPQEDSFRELPSRMTQGRMHHVSIPTALDSIIFFGGPNWTSASRVELFSFTRKQ